MLLPKISRFINKYLYIIGLGSSVNRYNNSLTLYSANEDKKLYSAYKKDERFLNFGSGAFFHKNWINYDYPGNSSYYKSLQGIEGKDFHSIDLCSNNLKIPENDGSVSLIYCSHTLEHLDNQSYKNFLNECFRMLKKNGVLRVALPNTRNDFYLTQCLLSQNTINKELTKNYLRDAASHILTSSENINIDEISKLIESSIFNSHEFYKELIQKHPQYGNFDGNNPDRHINYIDLKTLIDDGCRAGFSLTIPTYQGSSIASPFKNLHVFDNTESHISFYADLVK